MLPSLVKLSGDSVNGWDSLWYLLVSAFALAAGPRSLFEWRGTVGINIFAGRLPPSLSCRHFNKRRTEVIVACRQPSASRRMSSTRAPSSAVSPILVSAHHFEGTRAMQCADERWCAAQRWQWTREISSSQRNSFHIPSARLDAAVTAQEKVKCATDLLQSYKQFGKGTNSDEELWAARRVTPL